MSPIIIDRQRRLTEIGRIRMGEKRVSAKSGMEYPAALDTWRLTSASESAIYSAAGLYGGIPSPWGEQWQVTTETTELAIVIPPSILAYSAWFEHWSGGGCQRRCDGEWAVVMSDELRATEKCSCDPEARECKPTTRLSVILRDLQGIGTWRCESHGYNAESELHSAMTVLSAAWGVGRIVPGVLRLEKRERKVPGKPTSRFVVPVLDLELSLADVLLHSEHPSLGAPTQAGALPRGGEVGGDDAASPPSSVGPSDARAQDAPRGRLFDKCSCGHIRKQHKRAEPHECLTVRCECKEFSDANAG